MEATLLAFSAAEKLAGRLSERLLQLLLLAAEIESVRYGASREKLDFLVGLRARCREISEGTGIYLNMLLCSYGYEDIRELEREYSEQINNPEISQKLKYACAYELGKV